MSLRLTPSRVRSSARLARRHGACLSWDRLEDRRLMAGGLWILQGTPAADTIVVDRDPGQPQMLRAFVNGSLVSQRPEAQVRSLRIDAGAGDDIVRVDESGGAISLPATLMGGPGIDRLAGGAGADRIQGGPGDDTLAGGDGRDRLLGGPGDDLLDGGSGDDRLDGGPGRNIANGGEGDNAVRRGATSPQPERFASAAELRQFLLRAAQRRRGRGRPVFDVPGRGVGLPSAPAPPSATPDRVAAPATDFSPTNVQVPGVDEADIVETDGEFLYVVSREELIILDARPAEALGIVARTTVEGYPSAEYLDGDRLTVLSDVFGDGVNAAYNRVKVTEFDVADRAAPRMARETYLDGFLVDSRVVGSRLYLVIQNGLFDRLDAAAVRPIDGSIGAGTEAGLRRRLTIGQLDQVLPGFVARSHGPAGVEERSGTLGTPPDLLKPLEPDDENLLSVVVLDTAGPGTGPVQSASVIGSYATTVYASTDNLYLITPRYTGDAPTTTILKFALGGGGVALVATGAVPGEVLNQFSVDEDGEFLRIATTTDRFDQPARARTSNGVYVLAQRGDTLGVVGRVEGLAPGERLFAVRFVGRRGFLVTFEQVDPLFTLDLSDPADPRVVGELKLPGFSRYLQPITEDVLLGVGRDADPETGRTRGLQVSLFNVADAARPALVGQHAIAPDAATWAWSSAEFDHHAVSYFPAQGILAIPASGFVPIAPEDRDGDGFVETEVFESDLYVFRVDPASGFQLLGRIRHDSEVLRSVRIEEDLYSIADLSIKVSRILDALPELAEAILQTDDEFLGGVVPPPVPIAVP